MYKAILKGYIDRLQKADIIRYIENNNYEVSDKEIDTIYFYIKNYWEDIYEGKESTWKSIKQDVSKNTFEEIQKLYHKYEKMIK